jgi:hypothetical protein
LGALQPTVSNGETAFNTVLGTATGGAGQWGGNKVAQAVGNRLTQRAANAAAVQAQNATRDAVLQESRAAGYVIPPTDVNPSATATSLESLAGSTRQGAQAKNAAVTDSLTRADLNISPTQPLKKAAFGDVRAQAGRIYPQVERALGSFGSDSRYMADVQAIRPASNIANAYPGITAQAPQQIDALANALNVAQHDGPSAVAAYKFLRDQARSNFQGAFQSGGNADRLALARAQSQGADAVKGLIQRQLTNQGQGELAQAWDTAATTIAKAHQAEAALRGGHIDATKLAAQMNKNKPVTGGMGTAARFADMFGGAAKLPKSAPGVSKLGAGVAVGGLLTGHPYLAALPAASWLTQKGLLSGAGQRLLANPSYAPSLWGTGALNAAGAAGRYGGLLAAPGALVEAAP